MNAGHCALAGSQAAKPWQLVSLCVTDLIDHKPDSPHTSPPPSPPSPPSCPVPLMIHASCSSAPRPPGAAQEGGGAAANGLESIQLIELWQAACVCVCVWATSVQAFLSKCSFRFCSQDPFCSHVGRVAPPLQIPLPTSAAVP